MVMIVVMATVVVKKTHEDDDFYLKIFNFDQFCKKNVV